MSRLSFILLGFLTLSHGQLDPTSVLLIGLNDFEAVDIPDTADDQITLCDNSDLIPAYPVPPMVWAPSSTFINNMVMVCGGMSNGKVLGECYGLKAEPGDGWEPLEGMLQPAFRSGFVNLVKDEMELFWTAGGNADAVVDTPLSSSQIYDAAANTWFEGPQLPTTLDGPCLAKLNNTHILVTGGSQNGGGSGNNWIFDFEEFVFIPVGDFVTGERFVHGCATMADGRVIVAGGYRGLNTPDAQVLNSVELFDPNTNTWSEGPPLPAEGLDGNTLVGLSTGAWIGDVLLLGGHIPDSITGGDWITSDSIWRFKTVENEWELLDYKMKVPRTHFSVVSTPYHCDE